MLMSFFAYSQQSTLNINVNGTSRNMIVYTPSNLGQNRPLMITMHGMNQDANYHITNSQWEQVADTAKFLVVYPNGLSNRWDISGTTDTDYILAIINEMSTRYGIDTDRVYLSGFSMGGMMTYWAATQIAEHIAAYAPVGGYLMGGPNTNSSRPIPLIHTHGTTDDVVSYNGVSTSINAWVTRNQCITPGQVTSPYPPSNPNSTASRTYYAKGEGGVEVVLMTLDGKGHWWSEDPAGSIHTSSEIWKFVKNYSLRTSSITVSLTSPTENQIYLAPATVSLEANAANTDGTISRVEFFNGNTKIGEALTAPYTYSWTNVSAGTYTITAIAHDNTGEQTTSESVVIRVNVPQGPYGGTPHAIPGTIQFEHFDEGGNGFAYFDDSPGTSVPNPPNFRSDEDVDIENCEDGGNGYNIGWATSGEWLEYTVTVPVAGVYDLLIRAACNEDDRTISLSSNGEDIASNIVIPNTGGWQEWQDVLVSDVELEAGEQILRLTIGDLDYVNLNYMTFAPKFSLNPVVTLNAGWNIIGSPLQGSVDIENALSSIWQYVEEVKDFNGYYFNTNPTALNSLHTVELGKGYFIKVSEPCELLW